MGRKRGEKTLVQDQREKPFDNDAGGCGEYVTGEEIKEMGGRLSGALSLPIMTQCYRK